MLAEHISWWHGMRRVEQRSAAETETDPWRDGTDARRELVEHATRQQLVHEGQTHRGVEVVQADVDLVHAGNGGDAVDAHGRRRRLQEQAGTRSSGDGGDER